MLVNAYLAYKHFMENNGKTAMSHYVFRKKVVLAKICLLKHGAPVQKQSVAKQRREHRAFYRQASKRSRDESEEMSTCSSKKAKVGAGKAVYVSASRIKSASSKFNMVRLNTSKSHLPSPALRAEGRTCCALCRWATGKNYSAQLLRCENYNAHLCMWCYKSYHTVTAFDKAYQDGLYAGIFKHKQKPEKKKASRPKKKKPSQKPVNKRKGK